MFIEVKNNITNSLAVIADTSSGTRFALFPGYYDEERKAWKGVEAYENGTFGTDIWFTKCYLLEATGKQKFLGFIPHYTECFNPVETVLVPLWRNENGYSQYKGDNAQRVYGVITNTGEEDDIFVTAENGEYRFECRGFKSDDVCTSSSGSACVRVPERQLKPSVVFGNKTVKYKRLLTWNEDEL
nr:MAG TPA: hypothetical protein [Caudoviricetes sp.]